MKQTAVEWLVEQLLNLDIEFDSMLINRANYWVKRNNILEQAKEMEKKQEGYSEEEVYQLLYDLSGQVLNNKVSTPKLLDEWFEQFKKK